MKKFAALRAVAAISLAVSASFSLAVTTRESVMHKCNAQTLQRVRARRIESRASTSPGVEGLHGVPRPKAVSDLRTPRYRTKMCQLFDIILSCGSGQFSL